MMGFVANGQVFQSLGDIALRVVGAYAIHFTINFNQVDSLAGNPQAYGHLWADAYQFKVLLHGRQQGGLFFMVAVVANFFTQQAAANAD